MPIEKRPMSDPVERAERDLKKSMAKRPLKFIHMRVWEQLNMSELEDKIKTMHGSYGRFKKQKVFKD